MSSHITLFKEGINLERAAFLYEMIWGPNVS
jgi:hypothetical protein